MMRALQYTIAALVLLAVTPAWAQQDEPLIEVSVNPEEVPVGEPISLRVSVYVPTWFTRPAEFPSFEVPNAITRLPPNSSRAISKRVGRDSWSGIVRTYQVYPLLGARFRLESQPIDIEYANPGSDPIRVEIPTGEIVFTSVVPAGAETLDPYVAGTRLEISREVQGDPATLSTGDALVVTYTAELEGLSAIFLPELISPADIPGVSIYPEQPVVEDGETARRTEKVTYIFNAGGEFVIPGVSVDWWNREASQIETASVAALSLAVEGIPLSAEPSQEAAPQRDWWSIIGALLVLAFIVARLRGPAAALRARREEQERERLASEAYAWERAAKALRSKDPHYAHDEMVRWLAKIAPGLDSREFSAQYGDADLAAELDVLNRSLYADAGETADLARIARKLSAARRRCLEQKAESLEVVLPPLNP